MIASIRIINNNFRSVICAFFWGIHGTAHVPSLIRADTRVGPFQSPITTHIFPKTP